MTLLYRQLYGKAGKNSFFPDTQKYGGDEFLYMLLVPLFENTS